MNVLIIRIVTVVFSISFIIVIINSVNWKPKVIQTLERLKKQDVRSFTGTLDRIEGEWATLLIEEDYEELIVPVNDLPGRSEEGDILIINEASDGYYNFHIEKPLTKHNYRKSIKLLMDLKQKTDPLQRVKDRNENN